MKYLPKIVLFVLWLTLIVVISIFIARSGVDARDFPAYIQNLVRSYGVWGPIAYILLYTLRTLTFFSATAFTIASGLIFGPYWGIFYTIIAENLSANFAFVVGKYFGEDIIRKAGKKISFFPKGDLFKENGFMTVLMMRLLFFPFDWVGYLAGAYSLRMRDFAAATFIGTLPGLIAFVAIGDVFANPKVSLLIFIPFFLFGIIVARVLKKTSLGKKLNAVKTEGV